MKKSLYSDLRIFVYWVAGTAAVYREVTPSQAVPFIVHSLQLAAAYAVVTEPAVRVV